MKIKDLVKDWGGFEELITDLHRDGEVEVQRDVTLIGSSGASRQIDVLIKHKKGPYEYTTIVECKYWKKKVERANIDILYAGMQDLNASKGVIFTTKGYQTSAEQYAKSKGITIYVIRELTDDEWGKPGKVVDIYLHVVQKTIFEIKPFVGKVAYCENPPQKPEAKLKLEFGRDNYESPNIIISNQKEKYKTLESLLENAAQECVRRFQKKSFLINGGEKCVRYMQVDLIIPFKEELQILRDSNIYYIPKIQMTVGLKIDQSRIVVDRSLKYGYALAVVDCVNDKIFSAYKDSESEFSKWVELKPRQEIDSQEHVINGSILSVSVGGFFNPKELERLKPVSIPVMLSE